MDSSLFIGGLTGSTDAGPGDEIIDVYGNTEIHSLQTRTTTQ